MTSDNDTRAVLAHTRALLDGIRSGVPVPDAGGDPDRHATLPRGELLAHQIANLVVAVDNLLDIVEALVEEVESIPKPVE